jgi:NAD(P)-dependent dehydrogenase (short-subunit alcohol dehydrogenase family)
VNNAGIVSVGPFETMTRADYEDSIATHFWGTYNTVEAAWKTLCENRGRIVNVTSIGGRISVPHLLPYSVSKFATVGYSEGLRAEAARFGVSVTTVAPGLMRTGCARNAWFKGRNQAEYLWFILSDTLPFLSISATAAARRIVEGCARRESTIDVGLPSKFASRAHGLAPGLFTRAMEVVARLLPKAGENQKLPIRGAMSETGITQSPLTALGRKAETEFNQL